MAAWTGPDPVLASTVDDLFSARAGGDRSPDLQHSIAGGALWSATEDLGLTLVGLDEQLGGSGGSLTDTLTVLMASGAHAVALPLAETVLAGWLLASAAEQIPA